MKQLTQQLKSGKMANLKMKPSFIHRFILFNYAFLLNVGKTKEK